MTAAELLAEMEQLNRWMDYLLVFQVTVLVVATAVVARTLWRDYRSQKENK